MSVVYKYKPDFSVPGMGAQVVGEAIERVRESHGDSLPPGSVVEAARDEASPLHPAFEWDDSVAADEYRRVQERQLIRNVYVVETDEQGRDRPVLNHVSVVLPEVGRCHVTTARAMSDRDLREQVEAEALRALNGLRARYEHIKSLAPIFAAIVAVEAKVAARKKKGRNARPNANVGGPAA